MDRLVLFADRRVGFSASLARAAIEAAPGCGVQPVALVDATAPGAPSPAEAALRRAAGAALARLLGDGTHRAPATESLARVARRHQIPLLVPPGRDVNHPGLAHRLGDLAATLALSVGCLSIFRAPLLSRFEMAVNYHDGALPAYRGLGATAWSVYRGDAESGFTFHHMTEGLDEGPTVLEGEVPVRPDQTGMVVGQAKNRAAAAAMPEVLSRMAARDPGRLQPAGGEYFSRRRREAITIIEDPSRIEWAELRRRLRAFGRLELTLAGRAWEVTALENLADGERKALAFVTRDGLRAAPVRVRHLPLWVHTLIRPFLARR